jgi:hypothetical protein
MIKRTNRNLFIMTLFCYDHHGGQFSRLYRSACRIRSYMQTRNPELERAYVHLGSPEIARLRKSVLYKRLRSAIEW